MNLKSSILNKAEIAKLLNISRQTYLARLTGKRGYRTFDQTELNNIESLIKKHLA